MENCKGNINNFCYVCGRFTPRVRRHGVFSSDFESAYEKYFGKSVIRNVWWVPNIVCKTCYNYLLEWLHHQRESMPFGIPMVWVNPIKHNDSDCYACVNTVHGLQKKNMKNFVYKSVPSAQIPLPHTENNPPKCRSPYSLSTCTFVSALPSIVETDDYMPGPSKPINPVQINQEKLDFIVAKLELSQRKSEELASFLNEHRILTSDTKVSAYRSRQMKLQSLFLVNKDNTFAYCNDVDMLMSSMNTNHNPEEWRLFIDSSATSLKAILLHQTNSKPSVPIAYSTDTKETYERLQMILESVNYSQYNWKICCDLKVVAMLCGMQSGYTKYMCFLCDWDSRHKGNQYAMKNWNMRTEHSIGVGNVICEALVPKEKILLPPLHVKLGLVKSFVKVVAKRDDVFACLRDIFPRLSQAKITNGVLNGPDIRKLIKADSFDRILGDNELVGWLALKDVIKNFLGKNRSNAYEDAVERMLGAFNVIGVNMSLKVHFMHFHLDYFGQQLATESDEQGERYHQIALPFENRYKGKNAPDAVLAEICWWSKTVYEGKENEYQREQMNLDSLQHLNDSGFNDRHDSDHLEVPSAKRSR